MSWSPDLPLQFWESNTNLPVIVTGLDPQTRAQANHLIEVLKKRVAREMQKHVEQYRDPGA